MRLADLSVASHRLGWHLLLRLARPYRKPLLRLAGLAVLQTMLVAGSPALVGLTIGLCLPAAQAGNFWPLIAVGAAIVANAFGIAVLNYFWRKQTGEISQLVLFDLRTELFLKFQRLSVASHERIGPGHVINHLTSEVDLINALFSDTLGFLMQAILGIIITLAMMLALDAYLTGIVALIFLPAALTLVWSMRRVSGGFGRYRGAIADATARAVETLNGVHTVHAFGQQGRHDGLFSAPIEDARQTMRTIQIVRSTATTAITGLFGFAVVMLVFTGGFAAADTRLEIGVLSAFILYVAQLMGPVIGISYTLDTLQTASAALARTAEVFELPLGVTEPTVPANQKHPVRGEVVFECVSFEYGADDQEQFGARKSTIAQEKQQQKDLAVDCGSRAIHEMQLRLKQGEFVAMLGATGAGKSTIAKLITRIYDPTEGRVLLDGVDLRDLADDDLRRAVVMITQEGFLFSGSVADNIRVGRPDATDEEVETAAKAVEADAFIRTLADGYRTDVRMRGTRLSAGQRQLIAFARASLANPAVLILDEATASLDIPTERNTQKALRKLLIGRTALVIAHRLSTVEFADRVLVVNHGRIVEDGTPAALLERNSPEFVALYRDGHGQRAEVCSV